MPPRKARRKIVKTIVRKPVGQRRKIAKGPKMESRSRLKGEGRKFEARKPRQIGNGE